MKLLEFWRELCFRLEHPKEKTLGELRALKQLHTQTNLSLGCHHFAATSQRRQTPTRGSRKLIIGFPHFKKEHAVG